MMEELFEYLIHRGWSEDIASDIHDVYCDRNLDGVEDYARKLNDGEHDYIDEVIDDVKSWQKSVGEV